MAKYTVRFKSQWWLSGVLFGLLWAKIMPLKLKDLVHREMSRNIIHWADKLHRSEAAVVFICHHPSPSLTISRLSSWSMASSMANFHPGSPGCGRAGAKWPVCNILEKLSPLHEHPKQELRQKDPHLGGRRAMPWGWLVATYYWVIGVELAIFPWCLFFFQGQQWLVCKSHLKCSLGTEFMRPCRDGTWPKREPPGPKCIMSSFTIHFFNHPTNQIWLAGKPTIEFSAKSHKKPLAPHFPWRWTAVIPFIAISVYSISIIFQ
jgi:hypothetical protein